ncbi:hypothetical protein LX32DRAFT_319181 [Colletotrichum zoysiae]|uniref:Uncharacterized protein n=1 Tax=Colletotrichum zoysiae TaxID=1216348 RepID=A0AAD9LTB1_9PEZI|nr:hypothetical protein LX32DRAFT_319181 [Colletotrichum zoysiae]
MNCRCACMHAYANAGNFASHGICVIFCFSISTNSLIFLIQPRCCTTSPLLPPRPRFCASNLIATVTVHRRVIPFLSLLIGEGGAYTLASVRWALLGSTTLPLPQASQHFVHQRINIGGLRYSVRMTPVICEQDGMTVNEACGVVQSQGED